jgi:predicted nucleic acid-binding protein
LIVVDASLFLVCLLNEPRPGPENAVWEHLVSDTIFVPDHWPNEIANALRRAVRTKRLPINELEPITQRISVFDITFADPTPVREIGALAKEALEYDLSAYDMIYVRLAREHRLPLATIDQSMRRAAAKLRVRLLSA